VAATLRGGEGQIGSESTVEMARPELREFGELEPEDFERHPVWMHCHTADYNEPWYADTGEEKFRPWTGDLPAAAPYVTLLVRAEFTLRDGSRYPGFMTSYVEGWDTSPKGRRVSKPRPMLGRQQPQIFVGMRRFSFCKKEAGLELLPRSNGSSTPRSGKLSA
jgi:hypothetical protein